MKFIEVYTLLCDIVIHNTLYTYVCIHYIIMDIISNVCTGCNIYKSIYYGDEKTDVIT